MMKTVRLTGVMICLALWLCFPSAGEAAKHALVIGNGNYEGVPLSTPVNDADAMSSVLRSLGFSVKKKTDLNHEEMEDEIRAFGTRLSGGDTALFYFSGHGAQVNGINYLIPIGARIASADEIKFKAVNAEMVLGKMEVSGSQLNLIILDACRNNPFKGWKSADQGLAAMVAPKGKETLIAYATAPGSVAGTGWGSESIYTKYLAEAMKTPGLKIEDVFKRVRASVRKETAGEQEPWIALSVEGDYYLAGGSIIVDKPDKDSGPRTGSLLVETKPSGAKVYVNGVGKGASPAELTGLNPGTVTVQSVLSGYSTEEKEVSVEAGRIKQVTLVMDKIQQEEKAEPAQPQRSSGEKKFTNSIGMEFVYIPPGSFMMGSPENEPDRDDDEKQHKVTLTKGFYMQTTEVTQGQWKAVMGNNPSRFKDCGDNCPVENVSWDDVQKFIEKLNLDSARLPAGERSRTYRLPTEAEWEYAARAGITTAYFWGDRADCSKANYGNGFSDECKGKNPGKTVKVASFSPNAFGLYDMHGNVWEWCQDWYGDYPSGSVTDPMGTDRGSDRVERGGGWSLNARDCRSAARYRNSPDVRDDDLGFRLVLPVGQQR